MASLSNQPFQKKLNQAKKEEEEEEKEKEKEKEKKEGGHTLHWHPRFLKEFGFVSVIDGIELILERDLDHSAKISRSVKREHRRPFFE
ncbi:MAG: hypothetical protein Q8P67_19950 [archaeon]|nr:hypothetical protein [archaeon]